jgi:hypothetical protein
MKPYHGSSYGISVARLAGAFPLDEDIQVSAKTRDVTQS